MKKLLALLMALVLMLTGTMFAAIAEEAPAAAAEEEAAETEAAEEEAAAGEEDSDWLELTPLLTGTMDYTTAEWFGDSLSRALLTVLLIGDLHLQGDYLMEDVDLISGSYVGSDGLTLILYLHMTDEDLIVTYSPTLGCADYMVTDRLSSTYVEFFMDEAAENWHENSLEDIVTCLEMLSEALGG